jgi:capsular exopolysaccharide synthesis family protein
MKQKTESSNNVDHEEAAAIQAIIRFLSILRHRKQYVIGSLAVFGLLGALYYVTATRIYEGRATLFVTQTGSDVWNTSIAAEGGQNSLMPTCERLFNSAVVIDGALRRIAALPPQLRIDFAKFPRDKWDKVLRTKLNARAARQTNLIEVTYRSKSSEAATSVVDAVVESYLEFMDKNHRDVSVEIVTILKRENAQIEQQLIAKQQQLRELKRVARDLDIKEGSTFIHPVVQRAITLNDTLISAQKRRVELEASLAAVRTAIQSGADLRHHLIKVEPLVGRQLILNALGLSPESSENIHEIERKLIEDRAQLDLHAAHYGQRHPKVAQLRRSIEYSESYLASVHTNKSQEMANLQDGQLGPMLTAMIEQKLLETRAHESQLVEEYRRAETEAVQLNDSLASLQIVADEVERLSGFHTSLHNKITSIDINQNRGDIRIAVVTEPTAAEEPVSPRLIIVGLLCLVMGLGTGTTIVYALDLLDDRFRSPEEMEVQLGASVLAMVRTLPDTGASGAESLAVHVDPSAVECEAFRTLRTALTFSGEDANCIAITSCEPGDGKSTVLANLGSAFAQAGKRTLLIDADLRRPGLTRTFDLRGSDGLSHVLKSKQDVARECQAAISFSGVENLDILSSGSRPTDAAELLSTGRMEELLAWAECNYDQVLVDCPPLMAASDAAILGRQTNGIALVVQPDKNHRRVVVRATSELIRLKVNVFGIVANRIDDQSHDGYYGYSTAYGYGDEMCDEEWDDAEFEPDENWATEDQFEDDAVATIRRAA